MTSSFMKHLESEGKTSSTISEYQRRLDKFLLFISHHNLQIEEVTTKHLLLFREELLASNLSPRRINSIISTTNCYFNYLILHEVVSNNPVVTTLTMPVKSKRIERLSDEDIKIFRSYIDEFKPNVRCAFLLMLATGSRVGEITNLKKTDFSIKNQTLYINITDAKWGSDRKIPVLDQDVAKIVITYLKDLDISTLPVFRISKRTLQRHMTNFSNDTGITCHCHLLRHTFAAKLIEQDVPIEVIKNFLGHKNINMTAHYTHSARVDLSKIEATVWQA